MSAIAANVFSGLMNEITPAITKSTPNSPQIQRSRARPASANANCWKPRTKNISPIRTPTVVIEAWSNWRMTSAISDPGDPEDEPQPPEPREPPEDRATLARAHNRASFHSGDSSVRAGTALLQPFAVTADFPRSGPQMIDQRPMWMPIRSGIPLTMRVIGSGVAVLLLGRSLRRIARPDDRPARVAERLGRDADGRRVDDRRARWARRGGRAPSRRARGRPCCEGADAVAGVAEAGEAALAEACGPPAGGSARRRSGRPTRGSIGAPLELREEPAQVGLDLGGDAGVDLGAAVDVRAADDPAAAPAEGDPAVGGGAEVVDHVAASR